MIPSRAGVALVGWLLAMSSSLVWAGAPGGDDARSYLDKATSAYGLGRYAVAAENFEKAYELKPDLALLYNAAQSHRLAGNKQRALELYESYLRVYGKKDKREEVERHVKELRQAIEHDKTVATAPPVTTQPVSVPPSAAAPPAAPAPAAPPPAPAPPLAPAASAPPAASASAAAGLPAAPPPPQSGSAPVLVAQPASAPAKEDSLVGKPLFWVLLGGGVAAVAVLVLVVSLGGVKAPTADMGRVPGN